MKHKLPVIGVLLLIFLGGVLGQQQFQKPALTTPLYETNKVAQPDQNHVVAIVGATLIDGRGGTPIPDSIVLVRGDKIASVGKGNTVNVPAGAEVIDAKGLTLLPG